MLEALQELGCEGRGFVEAEASGRSGLVLIRVILDPLEEPVHDDEMVVKVRVQRRAEAMQETDRADGGGWWCRGTGLPEGDAESPEQDMKDGAGGSGSVMNPRQPWSVEPRSWQSVRKTSS